MRLDKILNKVLGHRNISDFARKFIESTYADANSIKQTYDFLKKIGLKDSRIANHAQLLGIAPETIQRNYQDLRKIGLGDNKIARHAQLLGRNPETIQMNYQNLKKMGLRDSGIVTQAHLLGRDPETIQRNYQNLKKMGLRDSGITSQAQLLGRDPETIQRNYQNLRKIGLSDSKIVSQAQLLGRDPKTIQRNYQKSVRLLRQNYLDRNSGRDLLINNPQLLGRNSETIEANIQLLYSKGINYYNNNIMLGTKPSTKRKKMAWMLRELFDYRNIPEEQKKETVDKMYNFVRNNPKLLVYSIATLKRKKNNLREKLKF